MVLFHLLNSPQKCSGYLSAERVAFVILYIPDIKDGVTMAMIEIGQSNGSPIMFDGKVLTQGESVLSISEVVGLLGISASELAGLAFPSMGPRNPDGSRYLRMTYGDSTGFFFRNDLCHEWRLGYEGYKVCPVITNCCGFPIIKIGNKDGSSVCFDTETEARTWVESNCHEFDDWDLSE
jgi:hypothetical protein